MSDPRIISLDSETYGACERAWNGDVLPPQTVFHPRKAVDVDGCHPQHRMLIVTITIPEEDTRDPKEGWNLTSISRLKPGPSFVFRMWQPIERARLIKWLKHADTIVGQNLPFDLTFLMAEPDMKQVLGEEKHTLIDLSVLNYLEDENRPEKSLKAIGPVLGKFSYDMEATLRRGRFPYPDWTDRKGRGLYTYGCEDTHNVILGISELARRIRARYGNVAPSQAVSGLRGYGYRGATNKLSPYCIRYYSDALWLATALQSAGIAMDVQSLQGLEDRLIKRADRCRDILTKMGITIDGTGSKGDRQKLIDGCARWVSRQTSDIYNHLEVTEKRRDIKFDDHNRNLLVSLLPRGHVRWHALRIATRFLKAQKLLSTYTWPLLHHARVNENKKASRLVRRSNGVGIAYPSWYTTPGPPKDGAGSEGGTVQARMTCKNPGAQTFPKVIKKRICSRFSGGWCVDFDLSQIELRGAALLSGERTMLAEYRKGREADLHLLRAQQIFEDESLTKANDRERQVGKTINFADLFLSTPPTMQETCMRMVGLEKPLAFFEAIAARRKEDRPDLWAWQHGIQTHASQCGYLELPLIGQSRTYTGGVRREDKHQVVNQPVQTLAAAVMNDILYEIRKRIPAPWSRAPWVLMTHQIYDAAYFEVVSEEHVPALIDIIEQSVRFVERLGMWSRLEHLTGNSCPLLHDVESHAA